MFEVGQTVTLSRPIPLDGQRFNHHTIPAGAVGTVRRMGYLGQMPACDVITRHGSACVLSSELVKKGEES